MLAGADARGRDRELARIGARVRHQLREIRQRQVLARNQRIGERADHRGRREVAHRVVARLRVQSEIERHVGEPADEQRVAVRRCARCDLRADERAAARPVLHHEGLSEVLREALGEQASDDVITAARRARHDDAHRPGRILLCECGARRENERGEDRALHFL